MDIATGKERHECAIVTFGASSADDSMLSVAAAASAVLQRFYPALVMVNASGDCLHCTPASVTLPPAHILQCQDSVITASCSIRAKSTLGQSPLVESASLSLAPSLGGT